MVYKKSKRGSSRRRGDEYQDLTALRLALELYIQHQKYKLFIEYEKAVSLDDIVIEKANAIDAYQVKYAVSPFEIYVVNDLTNPTSKVYFKKFSYSWFALKKHYPYKKLTLHLLTNRALDAELSKLINAEGYFTRSFIEGRMYKSSRKIYKKFKTITQLNDSDFKEFLSCFHFQIKQPTLPELIQKIQADLLDHQLGLCDRSIYYALKEIIEDFAINRSDALNPKILDEFLRKIQSKYLLPQKFEVNKTLYVERDKLKAELDRALEDIDGDYIIITGLPGSGKSTSLTMYFDRREKLSNEVIIKYYCFVDINDNFQKRRLETQSLRVNILSILQNKFQEILIRRYDYTENNFYQTLETLGKHFTNTNKKLIIFVDGLDHAERMESEIKESIIKALPVNIPRGIVIVVGTQELHNWPIFLKRSIENPSTHFKLLLFNINQTREYLIDKRQLTNLTQEQIQEIHQKSEGLPLYLRYIVERISEVDDVAKELEQIPLIPEGNIKNYYEMLWKEFVSYGRGNIRHLCGVLACLRFPTHKNELFDFQTVIDRPDFDDCFEMIKHLLKKRDELVEIFHNSFREFVLSNLDSGWIQNIYKDITNHLKSHRGSNIWFSYIFEYAYKAKDYDYVINNINQEFVDYALIHYRSNQDIENAIYWAVESARKKPNILTLSRLSALKLRTQERIETLLNRNLLSKTLLSMEKEQDVISYSYSFYKNQWLIDFSTTLNLLKELPNQNKQEIGERLFSIFMESFSEIKLQPGKDLLNFAYCLGIYSKSLAHPLEWLSQIDIQPDILETKQSYVPEYAPHLEEYLNAIVRYKSDECWRRIKKIKKIFSNKLIRYLLIRSTARHKNKNILRDEIEEYISLFNPTSNPELAFYAALAGLPPEVITNLLGYVTSPSIVAPGYISRGDPFLHNYRMIFIALGYEGKKKSIEQIRNHLETKESWYTSYLLYLLKVGECIGIHWAKKKEDWFNLAIDSIDILSNIKRSKKERIFELINLCQDELEESLFILTKAVKERYPKQLKMWFEKLKSLQDSRIWTTHYGIMESIQNYEFELNIYEKLSSIPECCIHVIEILKICEDKFKKSTLLKGSTRSNHFLKLALIAALCGFKNEAEEWLQYGIKSTLIYGYHKDITLFQLIDIIDMLSKYEPNLALETCIDILEMVDWMPDLTDGDETRYLPQAIFEQVAKVSKNTALHLLRVYAKNKARWQMQDCLEILIEKINDADPEILWALTSLFANKFSEDVRHPKQIVNAKQHIVEIVEKSGTTQDLNKFKQLLEHFIMNNITPRHWQELTSKYWQPQKFSIPEEDFQSSKKADTESEQKIYKLRGKTVTIREIKEQLNTSFKEYKETLQKLKEENQNFYESNLTDSTLKFHISKSSCLPDLLDIKNYLTKIGKDTNSELSRELGNKFIDLGDFENGLKYLELAYSNTIGWSRWKINQNDFKVIAQYNKQRAIELLINECYGTITKYSGYDVPTLVASAFDALEDIDNLKKVYQDYLRHCKELFEQLPKRDGYKCLKEYFSKIENFNQLVIHFLIDELRTIEIDLGNKLIDAYCNLCLTRPDITLPIFFERLHSSDDLTKSRLLTILYIVAFEKPNLIIPYAEKIIDLFNLKHFQWKLIILKIIQLLEKSGNISETIRQKLNSAQQRYFSNISYSTFKLLSIKPSNNFIDFYTKNIMKTILQQIKVCCEILSINENDILAQIENIIKKEGWTEENEEKRVEEEWYGHIHVQGYPYIPIITTFNLRVFNLFNQIIYEIIEKNSITAKQFEALWAVLQPADPEYKLSNIIHRPEDIPPLMVSDKDIWLSELNNKQDEVIRKTITKEWITIFEKRILSQDNTYEVPYRSTLLLYSSLIKKGLSFSFNELKKKRFYILTFNRFSDNEFITLDQAREFSTHYQRSISNKYYSFLPILNWKTNSPLFLGYSEVVSPPKYIINKYGLTYKNFDLYKDNTCVIKYEVWQEGYEDESYSRELLSYGTRLLIHRDLLQKIFQDHSVELCQSIFKKRLYFKSKYDREAAESNSSSYFVIIHN